MTAAAQDLLRTISLVETGGAERAQVAHAADGRYSPLDPARLIALVDALVARIDVDRIDYVIGFPEGGLAPAFAFGLRAGRPVIFSTRLALDLPNPVVFQEPHSSLGTTHRLHGLRPGDRVVIVEDEVTTGRTMVNAVRALRAAGVEVNDVAALLVLDDPDTWAAVRAEKLRLHGLAAVPRAWATRLIPPGGP